MRSRFAAAAAAVLFAVGGAPAGFRMVNIADETDIEVVYENGQLGLAIAVEGGPFDGQEFAPEEVYQYARPTFSRLTLPPGNTFNFLAPGGSTVFVYPQVNNPSLPYVGIAVGEDDPAAFNVFAQVGLELLGVSGPGQFALWQNGGTPDVKLSTVTGVLSTTLPIGVHDHYNFGFSAAGRYELVVRPYAVFNQANGGGRLTGEAGTLFFGVEAEPAPAPATAVALAVGAAGLAAVRRRRK